MATAIFPSVSSPIKSIQRGSFVSAGSTTISAINMSKSFITSFSFGSTGEITVTGNELGQLSPTGGSVAGPGGGGNAVTGGGVFANYFGTRSISGGTTDLTVREFGAYIVNSTTITATGACRWELVEYI